MPHAARFVAVLVALVLLNVSCESQTPEIGFEPEETDAPVQAETPEIDALRVRLVFDVADLVKDAVILPQAFVSAMRGDTEQAFRQACIEALTRSESLDFMIDTVKATALSVGQLARTKTTC